MKFIYYFFWNLVFLGISKVGYTQHSTVVADQSEILLVESIKKMEMLNLNTQSSVDEMDIHSQSTGTNWKNRNLTSPNNTSSIYMESSVIESKVLTEANRIEIFTPKSDVEQEVNGSQKLAPSKAELIKKE